MSTSGWGVLLVRGDWLGWVKVDRAVWMGSQEDAKSQAAILNTATHRIIGNIDRYIPMEFAAMDGKWKAGPR